MYAELINRTWSRFKTGQEKFEGRLCFLPIILFVVLLEVIPIQWNAVRWVDLLLLILISIPLVGSIFVAKRARQIYLSIKARELSENLLKYQKWEDSQKRISREWEKEFSRLGLKKN